MELCDDEEKIHICVYRNFVEYLMVVFLQY